jgi:YYY domain-containing protein
MSTETLPQTPIRKTNHGWLVVDILLGLILLVGAYFRFAGIDWGEYTYLHPDERFLIWVGTDISPVHSLSEYFDTATSSLNPVNRGHGFYVYGTLPMFATRYLVQAIYGHSGFNEMTNVGRPFSAVMDLLAVLLAFLIAEKIYDKRVGLLAAVFSALAVLQIQQSHFFTTDTFIGFFTVLTIYFAVRVMVETRPWEILSVQETADTPNEEAALQVENEDGEVIHPPEMEDRATSSSWSRTASTFVSHPLFWPSLGFGVALGCAVSSKINAAPAALALPLAMLIRYSALTPRQRRTEATPLLLYLFLAAFVSLLTFRVFQPYAFAGPGFFGLKLDPTWLSNMRQAEANVSGDVDFPFALQWARRSVFFAGQNVLLWGLGLPLGLLSAAGFLWVTWRIFTGQWRQHFLLWSWTGAYFAWQSSLNNPTMRYLLPIYPMFAIFAGWAIIALYDLSKQKAQTLVRRRLGWTRPAALLLGGIVILSTAGWAYAFTRIYVTPITRVAASRWIYQNIPGPIDLHIQTPNGVYNQPVAYPAGVQVMPDQPYNTSFVASAGGVLTAINFGYLVSATGDESPISIKVSITEQPGGQPLATGMQLVDLAQSGNPGSQNVVIPLDQPLQLDFASRYTLSLLLPDAKGPVAINSPITLSIETAAGQVSQLLPDPVHQISPGQPYTTNFSANADGSLSEILLPHVIDQSATPAPRTLSVQVYSPGTNEAVAYGSLTADFSQNNESGHPIELSQPVQLNKDAIYGLSISLSSGDGAIALQGDAITNESDFDDALPLRLDGYDNPYPGGLNFQMYWDDNPDKLTRFLNIMNQADYIVMSSNRQWGSISRVPERYPLSTQYYRDLLGCPADKSVVWCYSVAQPGMFQGKLGFQLDQVFESDPSVGPIHINDQFAEEAFTVYDHPKVLIFKKTPGYSPQEALADLGSVDLTHILRLTPKEFKSYPANLLLPADRLQQDQQGGTWSQLFNPNALQNRFEILGVLLWYLSLSILGLLTYPILRLAMPGLSDRGYPLARMAGMLALAYPMWLVGSYKIPFNRLTIGIVLLILAALGLAAAFHSRAELREEWRSRRRYFLMIEALALAFFLFDLGIRYANPDLWHPAFGGERPMDFAYFNAVLKSSTFPPYDPWYAGGYMNYYYYGFVLVGVPVKFLGIIPAFAYNLILPTMFTFIALGAFSIGWNLFEKIRDEGRKDRLDGRDIALQNSATFDGNGFLINGEHLQTKAEPRAGGPPETSEPLQTGKALGPDEPLTISKPLISDVNQGEQLAQPAFPLKKSMLFPFIAGISGSLLMVVLGNLGTVRMIYRGYQRLAAPGGLIDNAGLFTRFSWAIQGAFQAISGKPLPYSTGDWYWIPSRVIPPGDNSITEFPFFTVLYGDPHAHLYAMPVALLAIAWAVSLVLGRGRWESPLRMLAGFLIGGLAIGALYPINLSDSYTYLLLGISALIYTFWRYFDPGWLKKYSTLPQTVRHMIVLVGGIALLVGFSQLLYKPYSQWYGQAYGAVELWDGMHTPTWSYLTHWGLFLFIFFTWIVWESIDWMAKTPLSALRKLRPYRELIVASLIALALAVVLLEIKGIYVAWITLPLAAWALVLILRPGQPDSKRIALFLIGTGLMITLLVELVVVKGDNGRQNTVFKFYLQAWTLFAAAGGVIVAWMIESLPKWRLNWRLVWQTPFAVLVFGAALFTLLGGMAKMRDRWIPSAPHTLDGMAYMPYATYEWKGQVMDLSQDYRAIQWMQENIQGSPVMVEANSGDYYRWYNRFTMYTGLPDVLGWGYHETQQRALLPSDWIYQRGDEINNFYTTTDVSAALAFIKKYDVKYFVLGQLERITYPGSGLEKFPALSGKYWRPVYQDKDTIIFAVIQP